MVVLAWDLQALAPVTTSLHLFDPAQLRTGGRTLFPHPPNVKSDNSGRCSAVLLIRTFLAVLPAITPGMKAGVVSQHGAASVGNSFIIDLASMGMKSVRDFVFLHTCAFPP